ncbi:MAG: response regulator [bacterium]|nr:response regulator [bacterium]
MDILIAEDDFTSRNILKAILQKSGYTVVETSDGTEAWDAMQREDAPKLVLLDWMMPGMDGIDVCRKIRALETEKSAYIIMLTSRNTKEDIVAGLNEGANDYISKPFNAEELTARLDVGKRMLELQGALSGKILELREALDHIKQLQDFLPICSFCKKIRNDDNYWQQIEEYISAHTDTHFSHGICPECLKEHYPEVAD